MKRIVLLSTAFIILISCGSNLLLRDSEVYASKEFNYLPYYLKVYEADSLFLASNFSKSYRILDSLFKIFPPIETDNYMEYSVYLSSAVKSGNLKDIKEKVRFGYSHFGEIITLHPESFEIFDEVVSAAEIKQSEIKVLKQTYYNSLNVELRKTLLNMFESDQEVRRAGISEQMDSVDSQNNRQLIEIFDKYGYPGKRLTGTASAFDLEGGHIRLSILLMHQPVSFLENNLPKILLHVKKGNCDPAIYAEAYDRLMLDSQGKQYFGTNICGSINELCPLINASKIDSIRKSIGLPNIKYSAWRVQQLNR